MNAMRADCVAAHARDAAAEVLPLDGDGAVVSLAAVDRLTIEVTVLKAVHPALFAALRVVDRRHRAERVRLLGTRGLLAEQQPETAGAADMSLSSKTSDGLTGLLVGHEPHGGDGYRKPPSDVVVNDEMDSVFR